MFHQLVTSAKEESETGKGLESVKFAGLFQPYLVLLFVEMRSHHSVTWAGLKLVSSSDPHLSLPNSCDYMCVPPCPTLTVILNKFRNGDCGYYL